MTFLLSFCGAFRVWRQGGEGCAWPAVFAAPRVREHFAILGAAIITLGLHTGCCIAALLYNTTRPQAVFDDLKAISAAVERGYGLYGQVSCCPLSMDFTHRSPYPFAGITPWQPARWVTCRENSAHRRELSSA